MRSRSLAGKFFLYYENGKCACRVDTDGQWVPVNVHLCLPRSAEGKWDSDRLLRCGWTNDVRNSGLRHHTAEASAVLHYPLWDPEALWRKYVLHGEFANELPSGAASKGGLQWGECFHVECRDHYLAHRHEADGGLAAMTELFRRVVCLEDSAEIARQLACGVLIPLPSAVHYLWQQRQPTQPPHPLHPQSTRQPDPASPHSYPPGLTPLAPARAASPAVAAELLGHALSQQQLRQQQQQQQQPRQHEPLSPPTQPLTPPRTPPPEARPPPRPPRSEAVWTAGQLTRTPTYQLYQPTVERCDFRGPKPWRSRLTKSQREALKKLSGT